MICAARHSARAEAACGSEREQADPVSIVIDDWLKSSRLLV
jgi:hypothetical protein